jgi:tetratricopeptide (TPR) repeat protein
MTFPRLLPGPFRTLLFLVAVTLAAGCAHNRAAREMGQFKGSIIERPLTDPLLAEARRSVVAIEALNDRGEPLGYGTGFYIRADQVVTCLHVIEMGTRLQIVLADGTRQPVAGIHGSDLLMDTAVLWVTNAQPAGDGLRLRERAAQVGETAYVLAAPKQLPISASKGTVTALLELGAELQNEALSLSVPALSGFSGGPVLDAEGAVIGMLSQVFASADGRSSLAVPVGEVRSVAEGPPETLAEWRRRHPPTDPRVAGLVIQGEKQGLGREVESLAYFDRALALSPTCTHAWVRKGSCLLRLRRHAEAAQAFRRALDLEPGMITPRLWLSVCLFHVKLRSESLTEANAVVEKRPRSVIGHIWLSAVRAGEFDQTGALAAARTAIALAPEHPHARFMLGRLWDLFGCQAAAEASYREATRLQPANGQAWASLGTLLLELGRTAEGVEALQRSLADPDLQDQSAARYLLFLQAVRNDSPKAARQRFEEFLSQEKALQKRLGDPERILGMLSGLKARAWNEPTTHLGLASLFLKTQRSSLALAALEHQVRRLPDGPQGWLLLANLCSGTGRFERGQEAALKAISLKHGDAAAYFALGVSHCALGRLDEARDALIKASLFDRRWSDVHLALASVEARVGNSARAHEHFLEARRLKSSVPGRLEAHPASFIPDAIALRAAAQAE